MGFDAKKWFLLDFLILATLLLSCSLLVTSEKVKKLVHARNTEELPGDDTKEQENSLLVHRRLERLRPPEHPPPSPRGPNGPPPK